MKIRFVSHFPMGLIALALLSTQVLADTVIIEDNFTDGDRAATGMTDLLDSSWWTSSSSSGDELNTTATAFTPAPSLGLVTGTSGRGLHTTFATQTLANVGDKLTATFTFQTPTTITGANPADFRVGLFDPLGRSDLDADVSASSSSPNDVYGWNVGTGNTGVAGLPGYMMDFDVNTGATADFNFRQANPAAATGRLMGTTGSGSFVTIGSTSDAGYTFAADTSYTGSFMIERTGLSEVTLTGGLDGFSGSLVDDDGDFNDSFGFLGFHVNSNVFGSTNSGGVDDNGLDFTNVNVTFTPAAVPEPGTASLLFGGLVALGMIRRRK
jgi:hypothetical protein